MNNTWCVKDRPHPRETTPLGKRTPLFANRSVGSFTSPLILLMKEGWRRQGQSPNVTTQWQDHFNWDKVSNPCSQHHLTKSLVRPGFEPTTSRSADRCSPDWANQAAVMTRDWKKDISFRFCYILDKNEFTASQAFEVNRMFGTICFVSRNVFVRVNPQQENSQFQFFCNL